MLEEWYAHYLLYPWGGAADDERLAYALLNLMQAQTGGKWVGPAREPDANLQPFSMSDFLLHQLPQTATAQPARWPFDPPDPEAAMRRTEALLRSRMGEPQSSGAVT